MPSDLTGRRAMVAGVSPNIGTGIALKLAAAGAHVSTLDANADNAQRCAAEVIAEGGSASPLVADITDADAVEAAVAEASDNGPIDILVNAAGLYRRGSVTDIDLDAWNDQIAVFLTGTFLATRFVTRRLIADGRRGSVIVVLSTAAHQGQADNIGYCTAKAGLLNFTRAAAIDLAPHGIRVNALTPTGTDLVEGRSRALQWGRPDPLPLVEQRQARSRALSPLGVLPVPSDYGDAVVFLSSDEARMITGSELRVDAGTLARYWADPASSGSQGE